jgi:hypothetical protein
MVSMRLSVCGIIWIVGFVKCELDRGSLFPSHLKQSTLISVVATSCHFGELHDSEIVETRANVVGKCPTLKRGDVLSLRGGGGCLSCFPRNPTKPQKPLFVSFQLDVQFNTSAMNFTKFYPGILGSSEILGNWQPDKVRTLKHPSATNNLRLYDSVCCQVIRLNMGANNTWTGTVRYAPRPAGDPSQR